MRKKKKKKMICNCKIVEPSQRKKRENRTGVKKLPSYRLWVHMKYRCKRGTRYEKNYAARGIGICESWLSDFRNFSNDMGPRPSLSHSVDRIDNSKGYCKHNCRWATQYQQVMNSRSIIRKGNLPRWVCLTRSGTYTVKRTLNGIQYRGGTFRKLPDAIDAARKMRRLNEEKN